MRGCVLVFPPEVGLKPCALLAALSGSELIQTVREVKLVDIEVNSISLSWRATNGVTGYKGSQSHFQGRNTPPPSVPDHCSAQVIGPLFILFLIF